jgi:Proto-chlorophyllide reductase 57 kD subunit
VKFLCIDCDEQMQFDERRQPGDGTFAAAFACPACGRRIAMLANPMETQLVESLGVKIGGRVLDEQPMELVRGSLVGRADAFADEERVGQFRGPTWSAESQERLARVPAFVRGMVKRIYADYAVEHGIAEITPAVMDRARSDLGLEGM